MCTALQCHYVCDIQLGMITIVTGHLVSSQVAIEMTERTVRHSNHVVTDEDLCNRTVCPFHCFYCCVIAHQVFGCIQPRSMSLYHIMVTVATVIADCIIGWIELWLATLLTVITYVGYRGT